MAIYIGHAQENEIVVLAIQHAGAMIFGGGFDLMFQDLANHILSAEGTDYSVNGKSFPVRRYKAHASNNIGLGLPATAAEQLVIADQGVSPVMFPVLQLSRFHACDNALQVNGLWLNAGLGGELPGIGNLSLRQDRDVGDC